MPLSDDIRALADRLLARLGESHDFYVHTQQAWRVVQQIAYENRSVGIIDRESGRELLAPDLEPLAQRYGAVHLPESIFRGLSGLLEDWILGLARLWLTAHPEELDLEYNKSTGRTRKRKQEEIRIPLSRVLALPDRGAILGVEIERVVRDLTYERPDKWFRYLDRRLGLGCPDDVQRGAFCEMKAARDILEHNSGVTSQDYLNKAGPAARYVVGEIIQIDEPYLLQCFGLLRVAIEAMTLATLRKLSASSPP